MAEKGKKVLIITYYWPPSGGSGVQRWLKFVKYLPHFRWLPYVFTPQNPTFEVRDESLLKDVPGEAEILHFPIWEPYNFFFRLSRLFGSQRSARPTELVSAKKKGVFQTVSTWIRGNLLIPDPRIFWVKPSVKFLQDFIHDNAIENIITTGPPHSIHLIGLGLKRKNPSLRWLVDFRDPWSEWGFLDTIMAGKWARTYHKRLESEVLSKADEIITITPFYVRRFEVLSKRKVNLLTNGFDEDDFRDFGYQKSDRFMIRHVGIVNEKCDPRPFLRALGQAAEDSPEFSQKVSLEFIGEVHWQVRELIVGDEVLNRITTVTGNIPHEQLIKLYGSSSLLVLILTGYKDAEGFLPGKLFEYLATGIPVLGVGPAQGDAATLIRETDAGRMIDSHSVDEIKTFLLSQFDVWQKRTDTIIKKGNTSAYSRREITGRLTALLR